jgi:probable addiction module antidote protein
MRLFSDYNIEKLKDPEDASLYLTETFADFEKDHDLENFFKALHDVAQAQGGIAKLAKDSTLNRQNLYKVLSAKRQPRIQTIGAILHSLGFRFQIVPR